MNVTYVYQSVYGDGHHFEQDVHLEAFETKDKAIAALKEDAENVKKEFVSVGWDEADLDIEDFDDRIEISANEFDDWWEGKVLELEIQ